MRSRGVFAGHGGRSRLRGVVMSEDEVFSTAVAIEAPEMRSEYLRQACGADEQLRARVESLLRHHATTGTILDGAVMDLDTEMSLADGPTKEYPRTDVRHFAAARDVAATIPGRLGCHEILDVVGQGGMGLVLQARDCKLDRIVAIKIVSAEWALSATLRAAFLREARAAAQIRHPHVVTVFSVHDDGALPYLVMEFVPGPTLQQKIDEEGPLDLPLALRIGRQIAEGLAAAHARGFVHRDIKPANILWDQDSGDVKIVDFGLAGLADAPTERSESAIVGTPQFMSPEQARGGVVDARSDLYSLGCVIHAMIAGAPPYPASQALMILRQASPVPPPSLRVRRPDLPIWLDELVGRLLAHEPDQRPSNAREVADELAARTAERVPTQTPAIMAGHQPSGRKRIVNVSRRVALATVGLASLTLAGVIFLITNKDGTKTRLEVPDGATVTVAPNGQVTVDLAREARQQDRDRTKQATSRPSNVNAPDKLLQQVVDELRQRNRGFDGEVHATIENGVVTGLEMSGDRIADLSPLKRLTGLRRLVCAGTRVDPADRSPLSDLSPLRGLRLTYLSCGRSQVEDLTSLRGMPLEYFSCCDSPLRDLSPLAGMPLRVASVHSTRVDSLVALRGMPLEDLNCSHTPVTDFGPLADLPLKSLYIDGVKVRDLRPLANLPLRQLNWRNYDHQSTQNEDAVLAISTLEQIDGEPAADFRAKHAQRSK